MNLTLEQARSIYVGQPVAKKFKGKVYRGTVQSIDEEVEDNNLGVVYDKLAAIE